MHTLSPRQAGRSFPDAVRTSAPARHRRRAEPVRRSARHPRAHALAPAARRMGHLRRAPSGPHLPAAAAIRSAGADASTSRIRPRCRRATGTSPSSTTAFPALGGSGRAEVARAGGADGARPTAIARSSSTRPTAVGSLGALPLDHIELLLSVWGDRTARLGAREDVRYVHAVREPRHRGRRDAAASARPDLRVSGRAAGAGADGAAVAASTARGTAGARSRR